jgi:catechol 2,3-dioxygenase-like lactoylglutathione lyase family enzyme
MKTLADVGLALLIALPSASTTFGQALDRPQITGISHIAVYSADSAASEHFYAVQLGAKKGADPEDATGARYYFSSEQFIEVLPLPPNHTLSRLAHIGYNTTNAEGLRKYLLNHGVGSVSEIKNGSDGSHWFSIKDPEGNEVQLVQLAGANAGITPDPVSGRIIHVGFLVHSREAEDTFYQKVLGFRPYWYGWARLGALDWVSQQMPNGHDWLEYMLVGEGSDVPLDHLDARELGVLNHFSLGVSNMEKTVTALIAEDRLSPRHDGPSMGRDGKWQANLYDPDGTRVEFMEFQPVMKPCCSGFTADSPAN